MDNVQLCTQVLVSWCMSSINPDHTKLYSSEYESISFIAKVLRKKMEVFNIHVKLPDPLIMLIEICTDSNPGISQLILKRVLLHSKCKSIPEGQMYEVTPTDFSLTFPEEFPIVNTTSDEESVPPFMRYQRVNPKWEEIFHEEWDAQKNENGANKCDTPEWWMEIYS